MDLEIHEKSIASLWIFILCDFHLRTKFDVKLKEKYVYEC
jgi:hypothetical protein